MASFAKKSVVIGCYDNKRDKDSTDLHSNINTPPGVNYFVQNGAVNAALGAVECLGYKHPELMKRVSKYKHGFVEKIGEANRKFGTVWSPSK